MKPWMIFCLVLVLLLMAACTTPPVAPATQATDTAMPATASTPTEAATDAPMTDTPAAAAATTEPMTTTATAETAAAWEPLDSDACNALAQDMSEALGVEVTQGEAPITDP
ncbi:MAG: hypothetical protein KDH89_18160, partial [Anaerolineae bacterium]|nr:hypothetical protein [Anaerolineae bacterium]